MGRNPWPWLYNPQIFFSASRIHIIFQSLRNLVSWLKFGVLGPDFALLRSIHVVNEFNNLFFFQQGLVYVQEGAASFGNVLGTLNSFPLTACVKMTNDGCMKYYFFLRIYDFEYKRKSKCSEGCDFYGVAELARGSAVATSGQCCCTHPLLISPPAELIHGNQWAKSSFFQ